MKLTIVSLMPSLRMSGTTPPLLRMYRIILIHVGDQRPCSPACSLTCFTPVSEKLPQGHGVPLFCVLGLCTVRNTATRDLCDDNTLVKPAGTARVHVSTRFHHTRSVRSCESITYLVWRLGRRIACGPVIQLTCQGKTEKNAFSAGVVHAVLFFVTFK